MIVGVFGTNLKFQPSFYLDVRLVIGKNKTTYILYNMYSAETLHKEIKK